MRNVKYSVIGSILLQAIILSFNYVYNMQGTLCGLVALRLLADETCIAHVNAATVRQID